jgi:hypothetical protein
MSAQFGAPASAASLIEVPRGWTKIAVAKESNPHLLGLWMPLAYRHDKFRENLSAMRYPQSGDLNYYVTQSLTVMQAAFPTIQILERSVNHACKSVPSQIITMRSINPVGIPIVTKQVYTYFAGSVYIYNYTRAEDAVDNLAAERSLSRGCG